MLHVKHLLATSACELGLATVGIAAAIDEVRNVYGWAKAVVCAAVSYLPPEQQPPDDAPRGLVARIARGVDYHDVMRAKLAALAEVLNRAYPDARIKVCVDTNPLPERKLAVLAGIGRIGKNGCVHVDNCGSWVALGEIVTDAPICGNIEPTQLLLSQCGDCTLCIDACPTGAITSPGVIDRSRCISALTQQAESIQMEHRPALERRIYGCDVCQEVCPLNAGVEPLTPEFAQPVFPGAHPELLPLLEASAVEFSNRVSSSSIGWIGRTRIRRNAAIAAANAGCTAAIPALKAMRSDQDAMLRETARWAIKEIYRRVSNSG